MTFGVHPRGPVYDGPGPFRHAALFDGASGYLEKVVLTGATYTVSWWTKRQRETAYEYFWSSGGKGVRNTAPGSYLTIYRGGGTDDTNLPSSFFDPAAFDHFVLSVADVDAALHLNGVEIGAARQDPLSGPFRIGGWRAGGSWFAGLMSEFHIVDGLALAPDNFGSTDLYGRWVPKVYDGEAETYLRFDDALNLGKNDGTGDDWIVNGGVSYVADGPSINVATLQPFDINVGALSNGNLTASVSANTFARPTIAMTAGKWGTRLQFSQTGGRSYVGVSDGESSNGLDWNSSLSIASDGIEYFAKGSSQFRNGGSGFTSTHVLELMYDADTGNLRVLRDGVEIFNETEAAFIGADIRFFVGSSSGTGIAVWDFGQNGYVPSDHDYLPLTAANLPAPVVNPRERFNAVTYSGGGTVVGVGHRPSLLWLKSRSSAKWHYLFDAVRGPKRALYPNETTAEQHSLNNIDSFDTDGFTLNSNTDINTTSMVAWSLYAEMLGVLGGGTLPATVAASECFSIVRYTGNAIAGATVEHGLSAPPDLVIIKGSSIATSWYVFSAHQGGWNRGLFLPTTAAATTQNSLNGTAPTGTVLTLGGTGFGTNNAGAQYIAYCFRNVAGLCETGAYVGNASAAGPFVYTGFRPRFLLTKRIDGISGWHMFDLARSPDGKFDRRLLADSPATEGIAHQFTVFSNGFQVTDSAAGVNQSGERYLYLAMADVPFSLA